MKNWHTFGPSESRRGSAPTISVGEALKIAADARKASNPQTVKGISTVRLGGFSPSMIRGIPDMKP